MTAIGPPDISTLERRLVPLGLLGFFILSLIVALCNPTTYDAGDSVMHYQIARGAFVHPDLLLSHWGKPFFTLVASPFAQLGFGGMKLFHCLLALVSGWMLWRSAHRLQLKPAWLAPLFAFAAPEYFLAQTSGLTEPLFAFVLLLGVFLFLEQKPAAAAIVLSLLPFVRTEGFILLPIFGLYMLLKRHWKSIPLLSAATLAYMLIGGIFKGDFLWIWTENPYSDPTQPYGLGEIGHFPGQYLFVAGIPIYGLTILGFLLLPLQWLRRTKGHSKELLLLVMLPFAVFFGAHMFFWSSGIGHSMGLKRVMIGIVPLGALIALSGLQQLRIILPTWKSLQLGLTGLVIAYVVLFPILPNPAAIHAADLQLTVDQQLIQEAAIWMKDRGLTTRKVYSAHPSVAYFLGGDPIDQEHYTPLLFLGRATPASGSLILLDSWFGKVEAGYSREHFDGQPQEYRLLQSWAGQDGNTPITLLLYEKI